MMTILEALEAKHGHLHTVADWRITREKSAAELTDLDFAIIGHFDGATAAATARDARMKALAPPVLEAPPVPVATPAANVARLPTIDDADDFGTIEGLDAWAAKNADAAVPVLLWRGFVTAQREKRQALEAEVAALRARLSALEQRPQLKYAGVWRPDEAYSEGRLTTHAGALWLSIEETKNAPGSADSGWLLIVKSGRA